MNYFHYMIHTVFKLKWKFLPISFVFSLFQQSTCSPLETLFLLKIRHLFNFRISRSLHSHSDAKIEKRKNQASFLQALKKIDFLLNGNSCVLYFHKKHILNKKIIMVFLKKSQMTLIMLPSWLNYNGLK